MHTDPVDDFDTSEMLRQVFLRALTVPPPQDRSGGRAPEPASAGGRLRAEDVSP
ncbi:hypothetical protein [Streptomyces sp. NPDC047718]|uniref:hypothetical protein n=1 Tax=Streptomyces sp. NPDC047718 TaxID=3155479 RepID=UPI0033C053FA